MRNKLLHDRALFEANMSVRPGDSIRLKLDMPKDLFGFYKMNEQIPAFNKKYFADMKIFEPLQNSSDLTSGEIYVSATLQFESLGNMFDEQSFSAKDMENVLQEFFNPFLEKSLDLIVNVEWDNREGPGNKYFGHFKIHNFSKLIHDQIPILSIVEYFIPPKSN